MKTSPIYWVAALALAALSGGAAYGAPEGIFSIDGSGYAVGPDDITPVSFELNAVASSNALTITSGALSYGQVSYDTVNFESSFLRGEKFVRLEGLAERNNDAVIVNMLGRFVETKNGEALYTITGTMGFGDHEGKAVITASLFSQDMNQEDEVPPPDPLTVKILPEPRIEGAPMGHIDRPLVQIISGQSLTIINMDESPHRFVSGQIHEWLYERTGAPRICDPEGMLVDPPEEQEAQTGTQLFSGKEFSFTIPTPRASPGLSTSFDTVVGCDFSYDGVTDIIIEPGASASLTVSERGTTRLLDVESPWIQLEVAALTELRENAFPKTREN